MGHPKFTDLNFIENSMGLDRVNKNAWLKKSATKEREVVFIDVKIVCCIIGLTRIRIASILWHIDKTVQNQIRRRRSRCLIRLCPVCLQNVILKFERH